MDTKILSLEETNRMLPLLRQIVRDIMEHWNLIIAKRAELESIEKGTPVTAAGPEVKLQEVKQELNYLIDKINQYIKEVEGLGCFVEEFKRGIINFPSLYHGRKIFLCWHPGEEHVAFRRDDAVFVNHNQRGGRVQTARRHRVVGNVLRGPDPHRQQRHGQCRHDGNKAPPVSSPERLTRSNDGRPERRWRWRWHARWRHRDAR